MIPYSDSFVDAALKTKSASVWKRLLDYDDLPQANWEYNEAQLTWLAALESGDYRKGYSWLKTNGCFCALGVASEALGANLRWSEVRRAWVTPNQKLATALDQREVEALNLWCNYGLLCYNGEFLHNSRIESVAQLNDGLDLTFVQLARFIRWAPHLFFKPT